MQDFHPCPDLPLNPPNPSKDDRMLVVCEGCAEEVSVDDAIDYGNGRLQFWVCDNRICERWAIENCVDMFCEKGLL